MKNIINNNMKHYCIYLRKSRKDLEAEEHGQGETLNRHEKQLLELADKMNIRINKIYKEIVSGESIASRPIMQQLLSDVENGMWSGVLVVEVERLARGDTMDQGLVSQTFKYSYTQIITPSKIYDPNNEFDEEYFEFGLFMSRREYKTITRRLHNGIISSVKEGKFIAPQSPYGYDKYKLERQKGYSLKINPIQAETVKLIFKMFSDGLGCKSISNKLYDFGISPKNSKYWATSTISNILTNPVYIGKIKYVDKETTKKVINGKVCRVKNNNYETIIVDGIHEPIISTEIWEKVQEIRKNNSINCTKIDFELKNPMSSILKCGLCGKTMSRVTYVKRKDVRIVCRDCKDNVSSNITIVESKLLDALKTLLTDYKIKLINKDNSDIDILLKLNNENISTLNNELNKIQIQYNNLYDLLEQNIYDKNTFLNRSNILNNKIAEIEKQITNLKLEADKLKQRKNTKQKIIPKIEKVIDTYYKTSNIELKNKLLKSIIEKVEYTKINPKSKDDFNLKLFMKL